jgi:hypothetical protein
MAFLEKLKKKLLLSNSDGSASDTKHLKRKKFTNILINDRDPAAVWEIVGELGDGSYAALSELIFKTYQCFFTRRRFWKSVQGTQQAIRHICGR